MYKHSKSTLWSFREACRGENKQRSFSGDEINLCFNFAGTAIRAKSKRGRKNEAKSEKGSKTQTEVFPRIAGVIHATAAGLQM